MRQISRVFVINLARRHDRLLQMRDRLRAATVGVPVEFFRAVDAAEISDELLAAHGVTLFPRWKIPGSPVRYFARDLKLGEIGCSLSHHLVWRRIADDELDAALILEDDAILTEGFARTLDARLEALATHMPDWDVCYVGRKRLVGRPFVEPPIAEEPRLGDHLVVPGFSYLAHAYVVSGRGAGKLLDSPFLRNLIPVDELLPAMYARHPRDDVRKVFGSGHRLRVAAIAPSLAVQSGESSDTEASTFSAPANARRAVGRRKTSGRSAAPEERAFGLSQLLGTKTATTFLERHWPGTPFVEHGPVERLPLPPALLDLERLLRSPGIRVSIFGKRGLRAAVATAEDAVSFYKAGNTLYLIGLERAFPELKKLCRELGRDLEVDAAHVHVEAFASPGARCGSSMHYDFDVNFNVQLKGEKTWRIAPNAQVENPLRSFAVKRGTRGISPFDGAPLPSKMPAGSETYRMVPGSTIFVPRGHWHETIVESESLALAFVVKPPPFYQLLVAELSNRLMVDPRWRGYPIGANRKSGLEEALGALPDVVRTISADELLFNQIRVRWPEQSAPTFRRTKRKSDPWTLAVRSKRVEVELPIADALVELVRWLVGNEEVFSTHAAVAACPGTSPMLARKVVSYLIRVGVLERVVGG